MYKALKLQGGLSLQPGHCMLMYIAPIEPGPRLFSLLKVFFKTSFMCVPHLGDKLGTLETLERVQWHFMKLFW